MPRYFPSPDLFIAQRYIEADLWSVCEAPLWHLAQDRAARSYRALTVSSFPDRASSLRVDLSTKPSGLRIAMRRARLKHIVLPEPATSRTVEESSWVASTEGLEAFSRCLHDAGFWSMPGEDNVFGKDGWMWLLEAVEDGRYHAIFRWAPDYQAAPRGLAGLIACRDLLNEETIEGRKP